MLSFRVPGITTALWLITPILFQRPTLKIVRESRPLPAPLVTPYRRLQLVKGGRIVVELANGDSKPLLHACNGTASSSRLNVAKFEGRIVNDRGFLASRNITENRASRISAAAGI